VTARDLLPRLKKVKKAGRGFTACCPAHDDKNPSFSIADGDRGILFHCFAGCSVERIKSALGLDNYHPVPLIRPKKIEPQSSIDFVPMFEKWERETDYHFRDGFAMALGVDSAALQAVGCAWNGEAWAFPMKDDQKRTIGIRLRAMDGHKWAVTGSRQGLFIPTDYPYCIDDSTMYICEGPTDLAAAMTIGLYAIGRPACLGQEQMIASYVRSKRPRRVVLIADNDTPGFTGAKKLQAELKMRSCIYLPPTKDVREFVMRGGDANMVESSIRDLVWRAA